MTARAFDTGLAAPQRTLIRNKLVERFAPLLKSNGGYVMKLGLLPRPLRNRSEDELSLLGWAIAGVTPAIMFAIGRKVLTSNGTDGREWEGAYEVTIYAASSNQRSYVDGRLSGDVAAIADLTADPGIDVMLEHIEECVLGQEIGIATTLELRESTEDELWTGSDMSIWEQHYTIRATRDINPNRAVTALVTSVHVTTTAVALGGDVADPLNPVVETITDLEAPP